MTGRRGSVSQIRVRAAGWAGRRQAMPRGTGDGGMSLVEILVSVVILGIGVVGIMSALAFAFTATGQHRQLAHANTLAVQAMEVVADPLQTPFTTCTSAQGTYQSIVQAQVGASITVHPVQDWSGTAWKACGAAPALPLQQITISAPSPDGSNTVTMAVVKRGDTP